MELGTDICPGKGVLIEKFPNTRKPSHLWVQEKFSNLGGQPNWEEK